MNKKAQDKIEENASTHLKIRISNQQKCNWAFINFSFNFCTDTSLVDNFSEQNCTWFFSYLKHLEADDHVFGDFIIVEIQNLFPRIASFSQKQRLFVVYNNMLNKTLSYRVSMAYRPSSHVYSTPSQNY